MIKSLSQKEKLVLSAIHKSGAITRNDIAEVVGVSKMHATNIVKALLEKKLVIDEALVTGQRGQPTRSLRLKHDALYAVGVNFTSRHVDLALVNWMGDILCEETHEIEDVTFDFILEMTHAFVDQVTQHKRIAKKRIAGIGVSVPGDFVKDHKTINPTYFPQFADFDFENEFKKSFDCDVFIENDSNCATWAEYLVGAGKKLKNFIFVHIGHGIGGGIIFEGRLCRGANGNAGIFGTPFPDVNAPRPSGTDLLKTLRANGIEIDSFRELETLNLSQTEVLDAWLSTAANQLTLPLTVLARALDPEAIILGGRLPSSYYQRLSQFLNNDSFCANDRALLPTPVIVPTELAATGGVIGSAALCFEHLLSPGL